MQIVGKEQTFFLPHPIDFRKKFSSLQHQLAVSSVHFNPARQHMTKLSKHMRAEV